MTSGATLAGIKPGLSRLLDPQLEVGGGLIAFAAVLSLAITSGGDPDDLWSPLHVVLVSAVALAGLGLCGWSRMGPGRPPSPRP